MKSSKIILSLAILLALSTSAFAYGVKVNGTSKGPADVIDFKCPAAGGTCTTETGMVRTIPVLDKTLFATGVANGGATSVASTTAAVPLGYAFVRKVIPSNSDAAFTSGTLADGKPGQILTLFVAGLSPSGATTGGSYTITPTTSTGFASVKVTAVKDMVTLQFVDTTIGWVLLNYVGTITVNLKA